MTDTNELEKQLEKLREGYKKKLPSKVDEIIKIWKGITEKASPEILALFQLKLHSLHGTANTYGYMDVGNTASRLEILANSILENPDLIAENKKQIEQLLN